MNTNSIAFAIFIQQTSTICLIITMAHLIKCLIKTYIQKKLIFELPLWFILVMILTPSESVQNLMLDEAISYRTGTDLSDKSWATINKIHVKSVLKSEEEPKDVKDE